MEEKIFMMADGTYCHILPDKIVFHQPQEIARMPEMDHGNRHKTSAVFMALLLLIAGLFSFLYFTDRMITELYMAVLLIVAGFLYRIYLFRDTSATERIDRNFITSTKIMKRFMGYTTWVIFFTTERGEKLRRMVDIYDSKTIEAKAEKMIGEAGLL